MVFLVVLAYLARALRLAQARMVLLLCLVRQSPLLEASVVLLQGRLVLPSLLGLAHLHLAAPPISREEGWRQACCIRIQRIWRLPKCCPFKFWGADILKQSHL
jgi:hypothetical protein